MCSHGFGLDVLLDHHRDWLSGRRVGLVAHPASVDAAGVHTAYRLRQYPDIRLTCLFGPEHGFSGLAAAGIRVQDGAHADWNIPVFSLYGETRKPTPEMLNHLDVILFDLQDLPVRCYTYSSTLRLLLEAAAECGKTVVVADRPAPLCNVVDGPVPDPELDSFVGMVPGPYCYGLTTGELARLFVQTYGWNVELRVAAASKDARTMPAADAFPWIPPSPGIKTRHTALIYPATVFAEALPALDYGRGHPFIFQVIAAPWMDGTAVADHLNAVPLPGARAQRIRYTACAGLYEGIAVEGVQCVVEDEDAFRPAEVMIRVLRLLTDLYGLDRIWNAEGSRPEFFDRLLGSAQPRRALLSGESAAEIIAEWQPGLRAFEDVRKSLLNNR